MGSNTLHSPAPSLLPVRKRSRDDVPSPDFLPDDPPFPSKRPCSPFPPSDPHCSHLSFLEELCEFEGSLESSSPESVTQEELVTEMMKSLEKVIGAMDEPSVSGSSSKSGSTSQSLNIHTGTTAEGQDATLELSGLNSSLSPGHALCTVEPTSHNESQVEIRQFLDASDDELGIPASPSPRMRAERFVPAASEDWLSVDGRFSDFTSSAQFLPGDVGAYPHILTGWLDDGSFDQLEVPISDFSRDQFDLITSERYL